MTILISPAKRAYSWYQHTKVHRDPVALNYSFYDIISASDTAPKVLRDLRNRLACFILSGCSIALLVCTFKSFANVLIVPLCLNLVLWSDGLIQRLLLAMVVNSALLSLKLMRSIEHRPASSPSYHIYVYVVCLPI